MLGQKEQSDTTIKTSNTTRKNKSEDTGERRKAKKISRQDKIILTKQDILKQQKKSLPACNKKMHEYLPTTGWESKTTLKHNKKDKWIHRIEKELEEPKEGLKMKMLLDSLRATLKKYQIGKHQAMMAYMDSGFKIPFHERLVIKMNWCPWCNGYRRRKWTRRHGFKSWTRLIAFHISLIPLGKVWIQLFSLQLWVNSRAD